MRLSIKSALLLSFSAFAVGNFSCKKEDLTCTAIIKVVRSIGGPAPSAKVVVTSEYGANNNSGFELDSALTPPQNTKITDSNGEVTYTFKYPAILDIKVTHISFGSADDLIKLEEGETVRKTVTLQ
jgi:hypothetical protein